MHVKSKIFATIGSLGGLSTVVIAAVSVFVSACTKVRGTKDRAEHEQDDEEAPNGIELATQDNPMRFAQNSIPITSPKRGDV